MDIYTLFPSWFLPTLLLIFIPMIFLHTIRWKRSYKLPPSPPRLPIIGNLHQVILSKGEMYQTLWKLSEKYGPVMLLYFGSQPYIVISSSDLARQALKTNDTALCTRPHSNGAKRLSFNYMDSGFAPYGDHWWDMRKFMVNEFLGAKRTKIFRNKLEVEMEGLVRTLSTQPLGTAINLDDTLLNLVNDVVCKITLGKTYKGKVFNGRTLKEIVAGTAELMSDSFSEHFPSFGWIIDGLIGRNRRLEKCFADLDGVFQMIIDEHLERNTTKTSDDENDFVDDCVARLTINETKGLLMNVLNGAIDTSTTTIVWAMSEIVKNPKFMKKLQDEIRSCVGRKSMVHELDIAKMPYLKMVVKETLRLHSPPSFLIARECVTHCQIGGYDVFPGTRVLINSWGIGRDSRTWKERPTEFWPERFENFEFEFLGKNCEMIPFGGGRRACPGYNSSLSTVEFIIANLLYVFDWQTPDGVKIQDLDMEEKGALLITRKTPLCLVPITHNLQD